MQKVIGESLFITAEKGKNII